MTRRTKLWLSLLLAALMVATVVAATACAKTATVTYAKGADDATGTAPASQTVNLGTEITLESNPFTRTGYTFAGWSDGSKTYNAGDKYTVNGDVTFTAQWTADGGGDPDEPFTKTAFNGTIGSMTLTDGEMTAMSILSFNEGDATHDPSIFAMVSSEEGEFAEDSAKYTVAADGTITITHGNETIGTGKIEGKTLTVTITLEGNETTKDFTFTGEMYEATVIMDGDSTDMFIAEGTPLYLLVMFGDDNATVKVNGTVVPADQLATTKMPKAKVTIEVTSPQPAPQARTYFLCGDMNGWTKTDEYTFTRQGETNTYKLEGITLADGQKMKLRFNTETWNDGDTQYSYGAFFFPANVFGTSTAWDGDAVVATGKGGTYNVTIVELADHLTATTGRNSGQITLTFELVGNQGGDTPTDKTLADYEGYWKAASAINGWDAAQIVGGQIKFRGEEDAFINGTTDFTLTEDKTGALLVATATKAPTQASSTTITITFNADGSFTLSGQATTTNMFTGTTTKEFGPVTFTKVQAYTVSFDLGTEYTGNMGDYEAQVVLSGETAIVVRNPQQEGYIFEGWLVGDPATAFSFETPITADTTLKANWTQKTTVTVTFNAMASDATGMPPSPQTINIGTTISKPSTDPARAGYKFMGWSSTSTRYVEFDFTQPINTDTTIYAWWGKALDVDFAAPASAHTGEAPETMHAAAGETITMPESTFTVNGLTFLGWRLIIGGELYAANTEYTISANRAVNLTFTAVYGNKYTGELGEIAVRDDGKVTIDTVTMNYETLSDNVIHAYDYELYIEYALELSGTTYTVLDDMVYFTFTEKDGETKLTFDGKGGATLGTHTLTYTLIKDIDGYGDEYVKGFKLVTGVDEEVEIYLDWDREEFQYVINAIIKIGGHEYIFGTPMIEVTITYEADAADETTGNVPEAQKEKIPYQGTKDVTLANPTQLHKDGHKFAGWKVKGSDDGKVYKLNETYPLTADVTLVAVWEEDNGGGEGGGQGGGETTTYTQIKEFLDCEYGFAAYSDTLKNNGVFEYSGSYTAFKVKVEWTGSMYRVAFTVVKTSDNSAVAALQNANLRKSGTYDNITDQEANIGTFDVAAGYIDSVVFGQDAQGKRTLTFTLSSKYNTDLSNKVITWTEITA